MLYKSPIGILFLLLEIASLCLMAYTFGKVFDGVWEPFLLSVGVILVTVIGAFFAMMANSKTGMFIGLGLAIAITSPIFYKVWLVSGWPAGGFLCISAIYASLRQWRTDAESS